MPAGICHQGRYREYFTAKGGILKHPASNSGRDAMEKSLAGSKPIIPCWGKCSESFIDLNLLFCFTKISKNKDI